MSLPNPIVEQGDLTAQRANLLTSRAVRLRAQAASKDPQVAAEARANIQRLSIRFPGLMDRPTPSVSTTPAPVSISDKTVTTSTQPTTAPQPEETGHSPEFQAFLDANEPQRLSLVAGVEMATKAVSDAQKQLDTYKAVASNEPQRLDLVAGVEQATKAARDTQERLNTYKAALNNPDLSPSQKASYESSIVNLQNAVNSYTESAAKLKAQLQAYVSPTYGSSIANLQNAINSYTKSAAKSQEQLQQYVNWMSNEMQKVKGSPSYSEEAAASANSELSAAARRIANKAGTEADYSLQLAQLKKEKQIDPDAVVTKVNGKFVYTIPSFTNLQGQTNLTDSQIAQLRITNPKLYDKVTKDPSNWKTYIDDIADTLVSVGKLSSSSSKFALPAGGIGFGEAGGSGIVFNQAQLDWIKASNLALYQQLIKDPARAWGQSADKIVSILNMQANTLKTRYNEKVASLAPYKSDTGYDLVAAIKSGVDIGLLVETFGAEAVEKAAKAIPVIEKQLRDTINELVTAGVLDAAALRDLGGLENITYAKLQSYIDKQQKDIITSLEPYKSGEGYDISAAIKGGIDIGKLVKVFGADAVEAGAKAIPIYEKQLRERRDIINDLVAKGVLDTAALRELGGLENITQEKLQPYIDAYNEKQKTDQANWIRVLSPYKVGDGYDLAAALAGGVTRNGLIRAGFLEADIDKAILAVSERKAIAPYKTSDGRYNLRAARDAGISIATLMSLGFAEKDIVDAGMPLISIPDLTYTIPGITVAAPPSVYIPSMYPQYTKAAARAAFSALQATDPSLQGIDLDTVTYDNKTGQFSYQLLPQRLTAVAAKSAFSTLQATNPELQNATFVSYNSDTGEFTYTLPSVSKGLDPTKTREGKLDIKTPSGIVTIDTVGVPQNGKQTIKFSPILQAAGVIAIPAGAPSPASPFIAAVAIGMAAFGLTATYLQNREAINQMIRDALYPDKGTTVTPMAVVVVSPDGKQMTITLPQYGLLPTSKIPGLVHSKLEGMTVSQPIVGKIPGLVHSPSPVYIPPKLKGTDVSQPITGKIPGIIHPPSLPYQPKKLEGTTIIERPLPYPSGLLPEPLKDEQGEEAFAWVDGIGYVPRETVDPIYAKRKSPLASYLLISAPMPSKAEPYDEGEQQLPEVRSTRLPKVQVMDRPTITMLQRPDADVVRLQFEGALWSANQAIHRQRQAAEAYARLRREDIQKREDFLTMKPNLITAKQQDAAFAKYIADFPDRVARITASELLDSLHKQLQLQLVQYRDVAARYTSYINEVSKISALTADQVQLGAAIYKELQRQTDKLYKTYSDIQQSLNSLTKLSDLDKESLASITAYNTAIKNAISSLTNTITQAATQTATQAATQTATQAAVRTQLQKQVVNQLQTQLQQQVQLQKQTQQQVQQQTREQEQAVTKVPAVSLPIKWPLQLQKQKLGGGGGKRGIARHGVRSSYVQYGFIPEMYVALPTFRGLKPEGLGKKSRDKLIRQPEGLELLGEESEEPVQTAWGPKYVRKVAARVRLKVGATEKQRKTIGLTTPEEFYADKVITKTRPVSKKISKKYTAYEILPEEDIGVQSWVG